MSWDRFLDLTWVEHLLMQDELSGRIADVEEASEVPARPKEFRR